MNLFTRSVVSPTTVTRVKASEYENKSVIMRESGILLYGPNNYDIVLPLPLSESKDGALRLCRLSDETSALALFEAFINTIPYFWKIMKKSAITELQEICDTVRANQNLSIAHLVVAMNKPHLLKDPDISRFIDNERCGYTPIMLAIQNNNITAVQTLLSLKCCLSILDSEGKSVLHYAAMSDLKTLALILKETDSQHHLESYDMSGKSPLFYAITSQNEKVCNLLIDCGARVRTCTKDGANTALHKCSSVAVLKLFLSDESININTPNDENLTPLHVFVESGNYDCALCLLSHGANPSLTDANGNTPLHTAVGKTDVEMVKALVVFGASVNQVNNLGQPARHKVDLSKNEGSKVLSILHSVNAARCGQTVHGCSDCCRYGGTYDGPITSINLNPEITPLQQLLNVAAMEKAAKMEQKVKGGRLLCLDGGGVRGLILIQMLKMIEDMGDRPIIEYFDWVAGTSTGGIISLALASGKSLKECQILYFKLKDDVFQGDMPYPAETLEGLLKKYFGNDTCLSTIKQPKLLITSVLFEKNPFRLHLFRNYPPPEDILKYNGRGAASPVAVPIWKAARATSAAPGFFLPHERYIDGGLLANNPTLDALTEMLEYGLAVRATELEETTSFASIVVSCGTGLVPTTGVLTKFLKNTENMSNIGIGAVAWNIFHIFKDLGNIIVELITGADGRFVDRARAWCCTAGVPYYRLNPPMSCDISLRETSNKVIVHMMWETLVYMHNNRVLVKEIVDFLKQD